MVLSRRSTLSVRRSELKPQTRNSCQRHAKASETVNMLSRHFSVTCTTAKKQYSQLSMLLQASSGAKISPEVLKFLPPSFSPTPSFPHRVTKTPPPFADKLVHPNSAQTHRRAFSGGHYQPIFVRPTTFSLDHDDDEGGGGAPRKRGVNGEIAPRGLKSEKDRGKSHESALDNVSKAPVSQGPKTTKTRPKVTTSPSRTKGAKKTTKKAHNETTADGSVPNS